MARGSKASIRIDGLTEARATVALLPQAFKDQARGSLEIGRRIILTETARRVPVRYGTLLNSLGSNTRADGLQIAVGFGDKKAKWVEFATNDTPAQPSLYPGFRAGSKFVRSDMRNWSNRAAQEAIIGNVNAGLPSIGSGSFSGVSFRVKRSGRVRRAQAK